MPNGVFNWTFDDVVTILKYNGFKLNHIRGSHCFYVGYIDGKTHQVCVPKHGKATFKPRTLKGMVEQSGLSKTKWKIN